MFVLRGLSVSLSFFLLLYGITSMLCMRAWRIVAALETRLCARRRADLLLIFRTLPFLIAIAITLLFVLPSFLLLEPRVVTEPIGEVPLSLGVCCLLLLGIGVWRGIATLRKTARSVTSWLQGATRLDCYPVPLFRIQTSAPALTVAGVRAPRVLLSGAAADLLSNEELERAVQHEMVHVRRRDNLKKLLFRCCAFPGMAALETAWSEAAEMAADDEAVSNSSEALDLAAALIKLSRFAQVRPVPGVTGLSSALAPTSASLFNARVARLLSWSAQPGPKRANSSLWYATPICTLTLFLAVLGYGPTLTRIHQLTEWLVR